MYKGSGYHSVEPMSEAKAMTVIYWGEKFMSKILLDNVTCSLENGFWSGWIQISTARLLCRRQRNLALAPFTYFMNLSIASFKRSIAS